MLKFAFLNKVFGCSKCACCVVKDILFPGLVTRRAGHLSAPIIMTHRTVRPLRARFAPEVHEAITAIHRVVLLGLLCIILVGRDRVYKSCLGRAGVPYKQAS